MQAVNNTKLNTLWFVFYDVHNMKKKPKQTSHRIQIPYLI